LAWWRNLTLLALPSINFKILKIQDGERPPFKKKIEKCHISATEI